MRLLFQKAVARVAPVRLWRFFLSFYHYSIFFKNNQGNYSTQNNQILPYKSKNKSIKIPDFQKYRKNTFFASVLIYICSVFRKKTSRGIDKKVSISLKVLP